MSGMLMPREVPSLYRIVLAILGLCLSKWSWVLFFQGQWKIVLTFFMEIALNLYTAFGSIATFTILILPIQEHGRYFHFLISPSISFIKVLRLLSSRSFTSLVSVTQRYFMLFVAIVKGYVCLIFLLAYYLCIGGLLMFFSWFYILPHHWRYLWVVEVLW